MQREPPLTPKSRRANRPAPLTPDRSRVTGSSDSLSVLRAGQSNHRATMAPIDFVAPAPGLFGKRRPSSRQSMMPLSITQSCPDITRKPEIENKDLEMKLLYDKYLRAKMTELLMNKKKQETMKTLVSQIEKLAKEEEAIAKKFMSMKAKEKDIQNFTELQNNLDTQIADITAYFEVINKKSVPLLLMLQKVLQALDMLQCKNVIVPETDEDMKKIINLLSEGSNVLQSINNIIGSESNNLSTVSVALKDFAGAYADVLTNTEKIAENLLSVQILLLKESSHSLSQNEP